PARIQHEKAQPSASQDRVSSSLLLGVLALRNLTL
ncbi:imelysin family protein, partial [Vibrio parahaemolyticus V-223/04]